MGFGGEQGCFEDKGGVVIFVYLLLYGDIGGIGLYGFFGGGEVGGLGFLIFLFSFVDCVVGNFWIVVLICVLLYLLFSDVLSFKICFFLFGWILKVQFWFI